MTRGVNEIDEVRQGVNLVHNVSLEIEGDTGGLDGDTTFLFIGTGVSGAGVACLVASNNTGFGDEGVCQGRLAVIDVSDNRHVTDLIRVSHDFSDLVNSEVWHLECF